MTKFTAINTKTFLLFILLLLAFAVKTISRNYDWKNNYTLFTTDVLLSPQSARTHYNLGSYIVTEDFLKDKTRFEQDSILQKGITELKTATTIHPAYVDAWSSLGLIYDRINKPDSSLLCYEEALAYNANDPAIYNNIGTLFYKHRDYAAAGEAFEKATQLNPNSAISLINLGTCYGALNHYEEALDCCKRALEIDPNYAPAYRLTGIIYQLTGKEKEGRLYMEKAEEISEP